MNPEITPPEYMPPEMAADYAKWAAKQATPKANPAAEFEKAREQLTATLADLPDSPSVPYAMTPEGERWDKFKKVCEPQFLPKIDYGLVKDLVAFDRVGKWDGRFPGICATGATDMGKSRACWWALRRLYVLENKPFAWFPVRRLVTELERYEKNDCADEFFRTYDFFKVLFVDDIDKINWDFESHSQMLFAFVDWVYRKQKPCMITTNRDREWWAAKMGDAFVRRLFDDACIEVTFTRAKAAAGAST